jgi:pimeloyl-ACP methyl ester carboxylesterase
VASPNSGLPDSLSTGSASSPRYPTAGRATAGCSARSCFRSIRTRLYDGIVAFSQTDFTEDLKKITVPVLVMHGDDDQIVPYADSGPLSAKLLKNGMLKAYKGFPHGMPTTEAATINADLLAFIRD